MDKTETAPITVVISTRNRGASVVKTVQTILRNDYPYFQLRIVDQSDDDLTEISLQPFLDDVRICYIRTPVKGLSAGRNLGIRGAESELIAATDDDCETPINWLRELIGAFTVDRRIGVVFGNILPIPHDSKAGFVMAYVRKEPFLARSIREKHRVEGAGACMGLRRSVWQRLGGFDEMLGAGAPFKSAEETDFAIRALIAGYFVYETPTVAVVHHGFRTWEQGQPLIHGYLYGIGATLVKQLKCGHGSIGQLLFHLAWRWTFEHPVVEFGFCPPRALRLVAFAQGFMDGAVTPVDRARGLYRQPNNPGRRPSAD